MLAVAGPPSRPSSVRPQGAVIMASMHNDTLRRPIGWWLKEADARLDTAFEQAVTPHGIDRRGWQVLASVARAPKQRHEIVTALTPFDDHAEIERVIDALGERGALRSEDGLVALTDAGTALHQALIDPVDGVRDLVRSALDDEDYAQLVRLLARLVDGLPPSRQMLSDTRRPSDR